MPIGTILRVLPLMLILAGCSFGNTLVEANTPDKAKVSSSGTASGTAGTSFVFPLHQTMVLGGKLSFAAPAQLQPMSLSRLIQEYPDRNRQPKVILENSDASVRFTLEHTKAATLGDMQNVRISMSGIFRAFYSDATWVRDELSSINGKTFAVFEFEHGQAHARERILIYASTLQDTMLIVAFHVSDPDIERWLGTGQAMMNSLVLYE